MVDDEKEGFDSTIPAAKRSRKEPMRYYTEQSNEDSKSSSSKCNISSSRVEIYTDRQSLPTRDKKWVLIFADHREVRPNLAPKEVLQRGSFGGTYFRQITSGVTGETYKNVWKEFPSDWFDEINVTTQIASQDYRDSINTYGVSHVFLLILMLLFVLYMTYPCR
ncbi:hypothetical protein EON64_00435 [archaeon]|nr:MAG: hypothetical protein EON64_00435 [archaeon]